MPVIGPDKELCNEILNQNKISKQQHKNVGSKHRLVEAAHDCEKEQTAQASNQQQDQATQHHI